MSVDERLSPSLPALSVADAADDGAARHDGEGASGVSGALATPEPERYERRGLLGRGGMGRVVIAHDRRLARDVALKEVSADGTAGRDADGARLEREAQVTARLEHPGIVPVYDGGRAPDGTAFYTMRVVRGRSLHDALREPPPPERRARLVRCVLDAAHALAWAHRHGVVHRDLKPANIMIGELGETQVVDWGLAYVAGEPAPGRAGTVGYMSPEQAAGAAPDARDDVWSLGVVLRDVIGEAPTPELAGPELAAIVRRAQADLATRYPDAKAFADDLAAWLDGRRVEAHRYSTWELARRFVRAWRVPLAIALVGLVAVAVAIGVGYSDTVAERDRAEEAEAAARAALERADRDLARALVGAARERMLAGARPEAELFAAESLTKLESPDARGVLALLAGDAAPVRVAELMLPPCTRVVPASDAATVLCIEADALSRWDLERGRGTPTLLWRVPDVRVQWAVLLEDDGLVVIQGERGPTPGLVTLRAALDGALVGTEALCCGEATATFDGSALVFMRQLQAWAGPGAAIRGVSSDVGRAGAGAATSDGRLAWVDGEGLLVLVGADDARAQRRIALPAPLEPNEVAIVGERVAIGTTEGELVLVDGAGAVVARASGGVGLVSGLSPSPDGALIALRDEEPGPRLFDVEAGVYRARLPASEGAGARFVIGHPRRLATWSRERLVMWDVPRGPPPVIAADDGVTALDIDPRGEVLALGTAVGAALHRIDGGRRLATMPSDVVVKSVALSADGERVAVAHTFGAPRFAVHDRAGRTLVAVPPERDFDRRVARIASQDGADRWLCGVRIGSLQVRDARGAVTWDEGASAPGHETVDMSVSGDGRSGFVLRDEERAVALVDVDPARTPSVRIIAAVGGAEAIAASPDGSEVALAGEARVRVLDARDGRVVRTLDAAAGTRLVRLGWSPDGAWIAGGALGGDVTVWRAREPAPVARIEAHRERSGALAFDPRGRFLASGGWDDRVVLADLATLSATPAALLAESEARWGVAAARRAVGP